MSVDKALFSMLTFPVYAWIIYTVLITGTRQTPYALAVIEMLFLIFSALLSVAALCAVKSQGASFRSRSALTIAWHLMQALIGFSLIVLFATSYLMGARLPWVKISLATLLALVLSALLYYAYRQVRYLLGKKTQ